MHGWKTCLPACLPACLPTYYGSTSSGDPVALHAVQITTYPTAQLPTYQLGDCQPAHDQGQRRHFRKAPHPRIVKPVSTQHRQASDVGTPTNGSSRKGLPMRGGLWP